MKNFRVLRYFLGLVGCLDNFWRFASLLCRGEQIFLHRVCVGSVRQFSDQRVRGFRFCRELLRKNPGRAEFDGANFLRRQLWRTHAVFHLSHSKRLRFEFDGCSRRHFQGRRLSRRRIRDCKLLHLGDWHSGSGTKFYNDWFAKYNLMKNIDFKKLLGQK